MVDFYQPPVTDLIVRVLHYWRLEKSVIVMITKVKNGPKFISTVCLWEIMANWQSMKPSKNVPLHNLINTNKRMSVKSVKIFIQLFRFNLKVTSVTSLDTLYILPQVVRKLD